MVGGILGALVGVGAGVLGTVASLRRAKPGPERAFVAKASVLVWAFVLGFVALFVLVPLPMRIWLYVAYLPALIWLIHTVNRGQARVRSGPLE